MEAITRYLERHKTKKIASKVFLDNGVMLQGLIVDFDDKSITLDKCLILLAHIISISPERN